MFSNSAMAVQVGKGPQASAWDGGRQAAMSMHTPASLVQRLGVCVCVCVPDILRTSTVIAYF
jgi:hypothetical protein